MRNVEYWKNCVLKKTYNKYNLKAKRENVSINQEKYVIQVRVVKRKEKNKSSQKFKTVSAENFKVNRMFRIESWGSHPEKNSIKGQWN